MVMTFHNVLEPNTHNNNMFFLLSDLSCRILSVSHHFISWVERYASMFVIILVSHGREEKIGVKNVKVYVLVHMCLKLKGKTS